MLEFPKEYFQGEEIEGFYVDETMKTVWAAEIEVLNEVAVVCARHGLQWFMAYGSLLGTVRHQGFIPWDDDIDIWMKREDYRKFLEVAEKELPEEYTVRGPNARAGYPEYQVYINNSDSISIEPTRLEQFHGCPFYVGIDIFPLDDIPSDEKRAEMQRSVFASALMLQQLEHEEKIAESAVELQQGKHAGKLAGGSVGYSEEVTAQIGNLLNILKEQYNISISKELLQPKHRTELLENLWHAAEKMSYVNGKKESHQVAMYLDYLKYGKVYESAWFEEVDYLPYEGFDVPVPADYDTVLRKIYGDYTVCVRYGALHDYPCYKRQLEELRQKVAEQVK